MKWQQGLAVITRPEHWELAAKHLWGLSRADFAAYLQSRPACIRQTIPGKREPSNAAEAPAASAKAASALQSLKLPYATVFSEQQCDSFVSSGTQKLCHSRLRSVATISMSVPSSSGTSSTR